MFCNLLIYNENIQNIPKEIQFEFQNTFIKAIGVENSIFGFVPHLYASFLNEKFIFNESSININQEHGVDINKRSDCLNLYISNIRSFLEGYLPTKLEKITNKMELVRFYLMINNIERANEILDVMQTTAHVKMLKLFISMKNNLLSLSNQNTFLEFMEICKSLDIHSMLIFIFEVINDLPSKYFFNINQLIEEALNKLNSNKNKIKLYMSHDILSSEIYNLAIYFKLKIATILNKTKSHGMSTVFLFQAASNLFHFNDLSFRFYILSLAFESSFFNEILKDKIFDDLINEESLKYSCVLGPVERFYILNRKKILNYSTDEIQHNNNIENQKILNYSTDEIQHNNNIENQSEDKSLIKNIENEIKESNYVAEDCHSHLKNIRFSGYEKIFSFDIVKRPIENGFVDIIEMKCSLHNPIGVIDDKNTFFPLISDGNRFILFPDSSIIIKSVILENGEIIKTNVKMIKIEKESDLILEAIIEDGRIEETKIECFRIVVFRFLNDKKCNYFSNIKNTLIKNNKIYFIIEDNSLIFGVDIEIAPKIYQRRVIYL